MSAHNVISIRPGVWTSQPNKLLNDDQQYLVEQCKERIKSGHGGFEIDEALLIYDWVSATYPGCSLRQIFVTHSEECSFTIRGSRDDLIRHQFATAECFPLGNKRLAWAQDFRERVPDAERAIIVGLEEIRAARGGRFDCQGRSTPFSKREGNPPLGPAYRCFSKTLLLSAIGRVQQKRIDIEKELNAIAFRTEEVAELTVRDLTKVDCRYNDTVHAALNILRRACNEVRALGKHAKRTNTSVVEFKTPKKRTRPTV